MSAIAPVLVQRTRTTARPLAVALRIATLASGLLAGCMLAVLLAEVALRTNPTGYIAFHQATTGLYTVTLPPLGAVMAIAVVIAMIRSRGTAIKRLLVVALACGIIGMLVTVLVHFPLNATILSWPAGVIPADFDSVATRWLIAHIVRTAVTVAAFVLLLSACRPATPSSER